MGMYLDPKTDLTFRKVFGQRPHLLVSFLNAMLPLAADEQIESNNAKAMKALGMSAKDITTVTGLTEDEIARL